MRQSQRAEVTLRALKREGRAAASSPAVPPVVKPVTKDRGFRGPIQSMVKVARPRQKAA